jgi:hypothetical protein
MPSTSVIKLPYADVTSDSQLQMWVNAVNANQAVINAEITAIMGETTEVSNDLAPTNAPVPTGITLQTAPDGSLFVFLSWDYTQGVWPADGFLVFSETGSGMEPLPVTLSSPALAVNAYSRGFTFQGLNPSSRYTFGVSAYRKGSLAGSAVSGTLQVPTAAPDWNDVSAVGNYTANLAGSPATTVVTNAANGQMGFVGTVQYRTPGVPNGTLTPVSTFVQVKTDGSMAVGLTWNWAEGSRIADGFLVFWSNAGGVPGLSNHHFDVGKSPGTSYGFTLEGLAQNLQVSLGVAAYRRTETGVEIAAIVNSTNSPDWQDLSVGTPNYVGTIQGLEQHTFTAYSAGQLATDQRVGIMRDGAWLWNIPMGPARSYNLWIYDLGTKSVVRQETHDALLSPAAMMNVGIRAQSDGAANRILVLMGAHEPLGNRLGPHRYAKVTSGGPILGFYQNVTVTAGATYTLSGWIRILGGSVAPVNLDVQGTGIDTGGIRPVSTDGIFVRYTETVVIPAGTTSVAVRAFSDGGAPCYFELDTVRLEAGAYYAGTNLLANPDFDTGTLAPWGVMGTPGAGEVVGVYDAGAYPVAELAKWGMTRTLFTAQSFRYRSAYLLVGAYRAGEGNGLEAYAGTVDDDAEAACALTFQSQGTTLVALSGTGWRPDQAPGLPTANPVPVSVSVYPKDTGTDVIVITWSYTQPAMAGTNRLADGFVVYGVGVDTPVSVANANWSVKGAVDARAYTYETPHGQFWSFAVAAYRKTVSGQEIGPLVNSAAAPDWQGIGGTTVVDADSGIEANQALTPGPPTNWCTPTASGVYGRDTGLEVIVIYWSYTQPAFGPSTKPADGFWIFRHNGSTATPWAATAEGAVAVPVTHRNFTIENPHTQTWSFGIQPYRKTVNGIELGAATTSASAPDWQGIGGTQQVISSGIQTGQVQTPNMGNTAITTPKRQVTNAIGPTAVNVPANSPFSFGVGSAADDHVMTFAISGQTWSWNWNNTVGDGTRLGLVTKTYAGTGHYVYFFNGHSSTWNTAYVFYYW